ncbi:MAG: sigma-70 family RNA polymerase sigma factor [bacterium]|nr:sigma-70 family RNA polymerase sigma factor [bacterium]
MMKLYEKINTYKPEYSLDTWIYRVTRNLCIDHLKKKKHEFSELPEDLRSVSNDDPEQYVLTMEPPNTGIPARASNSYSKRMSFALGFACNFFLLLGLGTFIVSGVYYNSPLAGSIEQNIININVHEKIENNYTWFVETIYNSKTFKGGK